MRVTVDGVELEVQPIRWELIYPVHPTTPVGEIVLTGAGYEASLQFEDLGLFPTGDHAAEAIWARFLDQTRAQHEEASVTHGAYERHVR